MSTAWSPDGLVVSAAFRRYVECLRETWPPSDDQAQTLAAEGGDEATRRQNSQTA